jgi:hypothetical protein
MSVKAEEYRVKAADCDRQAEATIDPDIKAQFREFARLWRQVAEAAETGPHIAKLPERLSRE